MLVFACQIYKRQSNNGSGRYITALMCLDKRSGRKVYSKEFPDSTGVFELSGDATKKTVELIVQRSAITLTFTDKPIPPGGEKEPPQSSSAIEAIWKALKRAAGQEDFQ